VVEAVRVAEEVCQLAQRRVFPQLLQRVIVEVVHLEDAEVVERF
jgi:hypothetical protein